jgi:uncharacterized membrane-anchored protein
MQRDRLGLRGLAFLRLRRVIPPIASSPRRSTPCRRRSKRERYQITRLASGSLAAAAGNLRVIFDRVDDRMIVEHIVDQKDAPY